MLMQIVQFESALTDAEVLKVAEDRIGDYRALPALKQKYYLRGPKPNHYAGIMLWENAEAIAAFRESELGQTIGPAYGVRGAPAVSVHELMFPLR